MAKFAYISQKHSIDSQVEGYINKKGAFKSDSKGGMQGGMQGGTLEEKEKEKEKEQYVKDFPAFINAFNDMMSKVKGKKGSYRETDKVKKQFVARRKNKYEWKHWEQAIINMYNDDFHKENNYKYITPEFLTREDKLENWANTTGKKIIVREQDKGKGTGGRGLYEE